MTKREARQIALHMIFEMEFKQKEEWSDILDTRLSKDIFCSLSDEMDFYSNEIPEIYALYVKQCVNGVCENISTIDDIIIKFSKEWTIKRISKVSLAILRLALFEIKYTEIPVGASINEAVEITKEYDSEESSKFVNGILGEFVRNKDE